MSEAQMRASIDAYVAAWNEHDAVKRRALLEQACSSGLRFVARGPELVGREKLDAFMEDFQRRRPDARAVLSSVIEIQHHAFRYTGKVEASTVPPLPEALEVGECDDDGRIRLILSFVGAAPPRE